MVWFCEASTVCKASDFDRIFWSVEETIKQLILEALYLDLEDLQRSKSDGRERATPFIKSLLGASAHPPAKSYFYPTTLGREQRGYEKADPGGDHY